MGRFSSIRGLGGCFLCILFASGRMAYSQELDLELLRSTDEMFLSSYSLKVTMHKLEMMEPVLKATSTVRLSGDGNRWVSIQTIDHQWELTPYSSNLLPYRYDSDGNIMLSPVTRRIDVLNGIGWRVRMDIDRYLIPPSGIGRLVEDSSSTAVSIYPADHKDPKTEYYRTILALGRGFSQLIDEITSVEESEEGILVVHAPGHFFTYPKGTWELKIDPANRYLLRHAALYFEDRVVMEVETEGVWADSELPLTQKGTISSPGFDMFTISVELEEYSRNADESLLQLAQEDVTTLPPGTTTFEE